MKQIAIFFAFRMIGLAVSGEPSFLKAFLIGFISFPASEFIVRLMEKGND